MAPHMVTQGHSFPISIRLVCQRPYIISGAKKEDGIWIPQIQHGTYVWNLPPAAAEAALEELWKARIKCQDSLHVVLVPRLLTPMWQKQLFKASDLFLWIPPGLPFWPSNMFEPCCLALLFPFINRTPWQLRGTPDSWPLVGSCRKCGKRIRWTEGIF